jgi:predicted nuclease of predicted toxin-antitoxin system
MTLRFLIDAQLPPALAAALRHAGYDAVHVADLGLLSASDREIWRETLQRGAALITKDRNFLTIRSTGETGPMIVWVRSGNAGNTQLIDRLVRALPAIRAAVERKEAVIEIAAYR